MLDNNNFEDAKIKAHSLKGAAGNMAAEALRGIAESMENACVNEDNDRIQELLPEAEKAFAQIIESFESIKDEQWNEKGLTACIDPEYMAGQYAWQFENLSYFSFQLLLNCMLPSVLAFL